jgi:hypothetical protein
MQGTTPSQAMSEVDVILRDLKAQPGFSSYMIMNNDGELRFACLYEQSLTPSPIQESS